jgi:uncharacterized protein (DUF1330 family)
MTAYVIFIRDRMKDEQGFAEYHRVGKPARGNHPIKPLAYYGKFEVLEGLQAEGIVMFEFPSMEAAHAWYDSEAYQKAIPYRQRSSDYRVILFDGVDSSQGTGRAE